MAYNTKVIESTQMPQPLLKISTQISRWTKMLKNIKIVINCDLQNLVSGKHMREEEEGGRALAIINKNIYLVGKKNYSCHNFLIK